MTNMAATTKDDHIQASACMPLALSSEWQDSLFGMYELPATWVLVRAMSPPSAAVPDMGDIAQALCAPDRFYDVVVLLHGRVLGLPPNVAAAQWLESLRALAAMYPTEYGLIFGFSPEEGNSQPSASTESVTIDVDFAALRSKMAYEALTPEQRLRLLHTTAELIVSDPKSCPLGNGRVVGRPADEIRLGCFGHDSAGNDYYYFGDRQHLFREPGRHPRLTSFPASLCAAKEEERLKVREKELRKEDQERRKKLREQLENEKRARVEERKRAAEEKKAQKAERVRKREAEKARKLRLERARQIANRDPNARTTRGHARIEDLADDDARGAENDDLSGEAEVDRATVGGDEALSAMKCDDITSSPSHKVAKREELIEEDENSEAGSTTKYFDTKRVLGSAERKRARKAEALLADTRAYCGSGGTGLKSPTTSPYDSPVEQEDPHLRACAHWEVVASTTSELTEFMNRFGDWRRIKHPDERALIRAFSEVLVYEFGDEERASARRLKNRLKREKFAIAPQKKSSRLRAKDEQRQVELEQKKKAERRLSKRRKTS